MNKIFQKIFGLYLIVIIPLTGIILFLIFDMVHTNYIQTLTLDLKKINYSLQYRFKNYIINNDIAGLNQVINHYDKVIDTRITIINTDGTVLADSKEDYKKMENHATRAEVAKAMSGKMGSSLRISHTINKKMLYVALPLYNSGKILAVTRLSLDVDNVDLIYINLRNKILIVAAVIILISIIIILYYSKNITIPIKELTDASKKFASGDFNAKVFIDNKDELKELAENFNQMTDKIRELFENQTMQQEELKRIISSMQEGLIVLNKENKIVLHNKSFKKTVGQNEINGKIYWEVLRDINVQTLVEKVRNKKSYKTTEIMLNDIYYLASANYIQTKDEIVLVLFDISERKQLEDMKRDFIVNASHELRTPLTAIKGFVETMEDEAQGQQVKYLEIIKRHTSRLIAIVEDLLTISKLEDERIQLQLSDIKFKDLLKDVLTIFDERLKEKDLDLILKIDDDAKHFQGDYFKMEQLFINLIDNAIKYTPKGKIKIKIDDEEDTVNIEVSDTGIGIPQSDLNRIFERFYTVDKSRARKSGGTGLGLSIVKHIVNLHKGQISVESTLGKGTIFIVKMPKEFTV